MRHYEKITRLLHRERGAVLVLVALLMLVFVGIAALVIDLGHLYVVRNELQNAADSGALAGALALYSDDPVAGVQIQADANQAAYDAATRNSSENLPVEVNWSGGNGGDIQRGHWSFSEHKFTPSDSLTPIALAGLSNEQLDIMDGTSATRSPVFINAVRVVARRETNPVTSFFAGIFGKNSFVRNADAIAYIGFAGQLEPGDVDQPIAICEESILQTAASGESFYSCSIGRMINSGSNVESNETGGWTDFSQDAPCLGGTNSRDVRDQICASGNTQAIDYGEAIATNGGEINSAFNDLYDCWQAHLASSTAETGSPQPWELTLPVVTCPDNNVGTCETVVGAVTIQIVWINDTSDPHYDNAPRAMGNWSNNSSDGLARWQDFANTFNLQNVDGTPAPYNQKSIYFLPSCDVNTPAGHTGGQNFGVLARFPVLVK